jgi:hypothetical protein
VRIVIAATVVALLLVPAAAASFGPPLTSVPSTLRTLPVIALKTGTARAPSSCSVRPRRNQGEVSRIGRRLAPVACEQPPRSKVLDAGFVIVLAP